MADYIFASYQGQTWEKDAFKSICSFWEYWRYDQLIDALKSKHGYELYYLRKQDQETISAISLIKIDPLSSDLIYFYVLKEQRQKGLGYKLLRSVLDYLKNKPGQEKMFCEVRVSNEAAISLYEKVGFKRVSVRKAYYSDGENGLVMSYEYR